MAGFLCGLNLFLDKVIVWFIVKVMSPVLRCRLQAVINMKKGNRGSDCLSTEYEVKFSGCGEKEHRDGRGKVKCNAGSASQRSRRKCCVQNRILKSKKEPGKERPCSALIVYWRYKV